MAKWSQSGRALTLGVAIWGVWRCNISVIEVLECSGYIQVTVMLYESPSHMDLYVKEGIIVA